MEKNIMEEMFGKRTEEDITSLNNRVNQLNINNPVTYNRDVVIEHMKEQSDIQKYNDLEFVSIVIPSYNRYDFLSEVVDSIHRYADFPFELVIHDDNSNDGTKESLKWLTNKTSSIIYSNGLNLGLAESINRAVRVSSSEYILMLNADIAITKPFFKYMVDILKCPYVGFVNLLETFPEAKNKLNSKGSVFSLHRGIGAGCALGFTKTVFNKIGGWNSSSCRSSNADVSFMIRTIKNGYFPADLPFNGSPIKILDTGNKRSTIAGIQYDCSYPRLFNINSYEKLSLKRASDTNDFMQYSYRTNEGETNISYWANFCAELIDENNYINYNLSKRYGHDKWLRDKQSRDTGIVYKKNNRIEFDVGTLLKQLFQEYYIVQNFSELKWLSEKIKDLNPTVILEVGVEKGGTLKVWEHLLKQDKNSILIGIDLGKSVSWETQSSNVSIHLIEGNSHDTETLHKVKEILDGRKIDFVYIDGEHTSPAAQLDFNFYGTLVKPGGLVGFHDTNDVKDFLNTLPKDKLQKFAKDPPFEPVGAQMTIGTAVYHVS